MAGPMNFAAKLLGVGGTPNLVSNPLLKDPDIAKAVLAGINDTGIPGLPLHVRPDAQYTGSGTPEGQLSASVRPPLAHRSSGSPIARVYSGVEKVITTSWQKVTGIHKPTQEVTIETRREVVQARQVARATPTLTQTATKAAGLLATGAAIFTPAVAYAQEVAQEAQEAILTPLANAPVTADFAVQQALGLGLPVIFVGGVALAGMLLGRIGRSDLKKQAAVANRDLGLANREIEQLRTEVADSRRATQEANEALQRESATLATAQANNQVLIDANETLSLAQTRLAGTVRTMTTDIATKTTELGALTVQLGVLRTQLTAALAQPKTSQADQELIASLRNSIRIIEDEVQATSTADLVQILLHLDSDDARLNDVRAYLTNDDNADLAFRSSFVGQEPVLYRNYQVLASAFEQMQATSAGDAGQDSESGQEQGILGLVIAELKKRTVNANKLLQHAENMETLSTVIRSTGIDSAVQDSMLVIAKAAQARFAELAKATERGTVKTDDPVLGLLLGYLQMQVFSSAVTNSDRDAMKPIEDLVTSFNELVNTSDSLDQELSHILTQRINSVFFADFADVAQAAGTHFASHRDDAEISIVNMMNLATYFTSSEEDDHFSTNYETAQTYLSARIEITRALMTPTQLAQLGSADYTRVSIPPKGLSLSAMNQLVEDVNAPQPYPVGLTQKAKDALLTRIAVMLAEAEHEPASTGQFTKKLLAMQTALTAKQASSWSTGEQADVFVDGQYIRFTFDGASFEYEGHPLSSQLGHLLWNGNGQIVGTVIDGEATKFHQPFSPLAGQQFDLLNGEYRIAPYIFDRKTGVLTPRLKEHGTPDLQPDTVYTLVSMDKEEFHVYAELINGRIYLTAKGLEQLSASRINNPSAVQILLLMNREHVAVVDELRRQASTLEVPEAPAFDISETITVDAPARELTRFPLTDSIDIQNVDDEDDSSLG
ncbi:MAG: hypothetical protein ACD_62C00125G0005 [uncultured bacterium]|nr:MAG: hypothetical protein ACD_62C00125G0005 [uncultured bacterium]